MDHNPQAGLPALVSSCSDRADLDRMLARITVHLYGPKDSLDWSMARDTILRRCVAAYRQRAHDLAVQAGLFGDPDDAA